MFAAALGVLVLGYAADMMWRRDSAPRFAHAGPAADALAGALGGVTGGLGLYAALALGAACLGLAIFRRMTNGQFNTMVYVLLAASGVALLSGAV